MKTDHLRRSALCLRLDGVPIAEITQTLGVDSRVLARLCEEQAFAMFQKTSQRLNIRAGLFENVRGDVLARLAALTHDNLGAILQCGGEMAVLALAGTQKGLYTEERRLSLAQALLREAKRVKDTNQHGPERSLMRLKLLSGSAGRPKFRKKAESRQTEQLSAET